MKTAISMPDDVFDQAERAAARRGWSRSKLYTTAVVAFLATEDGDDSVTATLDRLADEIGSSHPDHAGRTLIAAGQWEW